MILAEIETFTSSGIHSEQEVSLDAGVEAAVTSLQNAWSATLTLRSDSQELRVSASSGAFAVFLSEDDGYFDFVGDREVRGEREFVHGGQAAPHPCRQVVRMEDALEVAIDFVRAGGKLALDPARWEKQT